MKIFRKNNDTIILGSEYATFSRFQEKIKEGSFFELEEEFLEKVKAITESERKQIKYIMKNGIYDCESKTSNWLALVVPCNISIIAIFASIYVAINNLAEGVVFKAILLLLSGIAGALLILFAMVKMGKKYFEYRELEKFYRFYFDVLNE